MISGLDLNAVVDYTLKDDKENPTIWKIGVLPSSLYAKILAENTGFIQLYSLIQVGLKGWENFNVPFRTEKQKILNVELDVIPMEILDRIDQNIIAELALKIINVNKVSREEIKN